MEPWQRVWIDAETYTQDLHALINCTACHGGRGVDDFTLAHEGLIDRPAENVETCGRCHTDIGEANANSLHSTLAGYDTSLYSRSTPENHPVIEEAQANHCNSCHTTCGDCHISQPPNVGGGLLDGHVYLGTPPMSQTCTACHGSRVKNEYYGLNEGIPGDAHFRARMACSECHTADEIHGVDPGVVGADHRYDGTQTPDCESCHLERIGVGSGIPMHEVHGTEVLSCQTCHSTQYTNCVNCHVEQTDGGVPFYRVEDNSLGFYLGLNPQRSAERPYRYVPLRHVPVDVDSLSFYGENLLNNFDALPTWLYATPHNIQRITPQAESCLSCHDNDAVFLTRDKVGEAEWAANASVMVEAAPPLPAGYESYVVTEEAAAAEDDSGGGFWGDDGAAPTAAPADDGGFWGEGGGEATPVPTTSSSDFWGGDSAPTPTPSGDDFWGG
ncbi:MAG: hypothetical protein JNL42_06690 [Anaerolineae bacterium]|nr:hypothetical protein [Anaerolineae bacterium]